MLQGLLLGLAVNVGCLSVCSPILLPFLLSENNKAVSAIIRFMTGRLIAYLFFASTIGYAGIYFQGRINPKIFSIATIILSIWLIAYAAGKTNLNISACRWMGKYMSGRNFPLFTGIVMGLNICPPFLIGISRILEMGSVIKSVIFFVGFYFGSSLWLLLLLIARPLSGKKEVRIFGQAASILIGLWYFIRGVMILKDLL